MPAIIEQLEKLLGKCHNSPIAASIVNAAIQKLTLDHSEICSLKGEIAMLAELLAKLESDKTAALNQVKDAAAKELADLSASGKLLSDVDFAALNSELAKNGLDFTGKPITPPAV